MAIQRLPDDRQVLSLDLILAAVSEATRTALEKPTTSGNYEFQSDFAKKSLAKGHAEGRAEGEAKALLAVLEARSVHVPDEARARILACTDAAQLEAWLRRAATATTVDQVF